MKRFTIILLSALLLLGISFQARAESSATTYTGTAYLEQQVFTYAYNDSGSEITPNSTVILDSGATAGSTLGAYIDLGSTADSIYVFGVADETIGIGEVGRICIRGPHLIHTEYGASWTAGDLMAASSTEGTAEEYSTADGTAGGVLGWYMADHATTVGLVYGFVQPRVHK